MRILYFARASELAQCREEEWPIAESMSLDQFWQEALRRHPDLSLIRDQCRVASGGEYVQADGTLHPKEEAAVIPPVSGG